MMRSCVIEFVFFFLQMSLADLHFYAVMEAIVGSNPGALKGNPKLKDLYDRVASTPKVAEYLKKRPVTPF